jgi:hypothetical protein
MDAEGPALRRSRSQRLLSLISERDWVGIAIEFAIVTLGVLLAFQIDQWGQDRRQAREERQFLERMWKETSSIASESGHAADMHVTEANGLLQIYRARTDPRQLQRLSAQQGGPGCRIYVLPSQGASDTAAQELLNSGRLNIVSDPQLRDDLRTLAASQSEAAEQLSYARQAVPIISDRFDRYVTSSLDENDEGTCRVNWSAALADPLAMQAVLRGRRLHQFMGEEREAVKQRALIVHQKLACSLGEPDCRR